MKSIFCAVLAVIAWLLLLTAPRAEADDQELRVGYFPNITHAHALIAQNMAVTGQSWYEQYLPGIKISWQSFNAGPSAMESLFAKAVDLTYVGPNPVLNAYLRSKGGVTVISGAVRGGVGLVVPQDSPRAKPADFRGGRIATPQLGNTQDIAYRSWLTQAGLNVTMTGGDVSIIPTPNPSILPLFISGQVDGAWTVEPWVSRLEMEGQGRLVYAEPAESSLTTVLSCGAAFQQKSPDLVAAFVKGHQELTQWILNNPEEAQRRVTDELSRQMRREFPLELVRHAWPRLVFENAVSSEEFVSSLKAAQDAGFIKAGDHDLGRLLASQ